MSGKKLITEIDILSIILKGKNKIEIYGNELFTPAAKDKISEAKIKVVKINETTNNNCFANKSFSKLKKLAIGADHTGYSVKLKIIEFLKDLKYEVIDVGTFDEKSCDYPDFAEKVSKAIKKKDVHFGILLDATGIPSAITANKFSGIRAATCYDEFSANSAREHNNANILVLGAKTFSEEKIKSIINVWLNSEFLGDRHQKRLDKITKIEKEQIQK